MTTERKALPLTTEAITPGVEMELERVPFYGGSERNARYRMTRRVVSEVRPRGKGGLYLKFKGSKKEYRAVLSDLGLWVGNLNRRYEVYEILSA